MSVTTAAPRVAPASSGAPFLACVAPDLAAVEARLRAEIGSEVERVCALSGHVLSAGGKRLRPALVALCARAVHPDPDAERIVLVSASVELVHMATLVHDDVVDNTTLRRGQPTANAVFGNGAAVLVGDFLLARAMQILSLDGDLSVMRTVADVTIEMSEGEVMEILATGDATITFERYIDILQKKTAAFVMGCCRCGALIGGATEEQRSSLSEYGRHVGLAFQIADDLLDYTGDPEITGKPIGSDLRDGRATLPVLLALDEARAVDRDRILAAFGNAALDDRSLAGVAAILARYDAFDRTREVALAHVRDAARAVDWLPASPVRDALLALADYVVNRDR
jgi:octaprenyl-diphosphate synthase